MGLLLSQNSLGLLPLPLGISYIVTVEPSAPHLHELHDHYTMHMTISNYNYQSFKESHKQLQDISIGDEVLIRVHPERFLLKTLKKLHTRRKGPYKILKRFGSGQCFKYRISAIYRSAKLYAGYRIPGDISRYDTKYWLIYQ